MFIMVKMRGSSVPRVKITCDMYGNKIRQGEGGPRNRDLIPHVSLILLPSWQPRPWRENVK